MLFSVKTLVQSSVLKGKKKKKNTDVQHMKLFLSTELKAQKTHTGTQ